MTEPDEETVLELYDAQGTCHFRILFKPPYSHEALDLSKRTWREAVFDVAAWPFAARAETTLVEEEVEQVLNLIERFHAGENVEFDEDQQFRFSLTYVMEEDVQLVLVTTTLSTEGGPYPELRFEVLPTPATESGRIS